MKPFRVGIFSLWIALVVCSTTVLDGWTEWKREVPDKLTNAFKDVVSTDPALKKEFENKVGVKAVEYREKLNENQLPSNYEIKVVSCLKGELEGGRCKGDNSDTYTFSNKPEGEGDQLVYNVAKRSSAEDGDLNSASPVTSIGTSEVHDNDQKPSVDNKKIVQKFNRVAKHFEGDAWQRVSKVADKLDKMHLGQKHETPGTNTSVKKEEEELKKAFGVNFDK